MTPSSTEPVACVDSNQPHGFLTPLPFVTPYALNMASCHQSTRQLLEKTPSYACLYRHKRNDGYYGVKKGSGKRKEHSLGTIARKLAESSLKPRFADLERVVSQAERTTLALLLGKFVATNQGKAPKTRASNSAVIKVLKTTWQPGLDLRVSAIKPSHLNEWLAQHEARLKNTTYNRYCGFLKQLFETAVQDRNIAESPLNGVKTKGRSRRSRFGMSPRYRSCSHDKWALTLPVGCAMRMTI